MNPIGAFSTAPVPQIVFGSGCLQRLPKLVAERAQHILLITGSQSLENSPHWDDLLENFMVSGIVWEQAHVEGEPSPALVDEIVSTYQGAGIELVLGIGGGSVLDAAKAVAGLLPSGDSVMEYLEGVGYGRDYEGPALPMIAVPSTAGTGSETTKNAVISQRGMDGFKKSFRHDSLMPVLALVDPDLLKSCPPELIAANGMDAFTQLLEAFVSSRANPMTDALVISGLKAFVQGFWDLYANPAADEYQQARENLAYAALTSGIALAQAGLGVVHGLASPLGAFFPCPHGVVCGTLLAEATEINIRALQQRAPESIALSKYAEVGCLLANETLPGHSALNFLVQQLRTWTETLPLPRLGGYGMVADDVARCVEQAHGNSMRTNPIALTDEELSEVLLRRL